MPYKPGPKELQLAAMKSGVFRQFQTEGKPSKPNTAPVQASAPIKETPPMGAKTQNKSKRKVKKGRVKRSRADAATNLRKAKASLKSGGFAEVKGKAKTRKPVTALEVAEFMARPMGAVPGAPGGASMEELVAEFGIEAHPMRAKVHYVKTKLNWTVEHDGGRYRATPPAGYEPQHALKA